MNNFLGLGLTAQANNLNDAKTPLSIKNLYIHEVKIGVKKPQRIKDVDISMSVRTSG
jgi:hypothetical protein